MCLLQSKAPPISKIDPTLLFLPVFKMYRHDISTLLHWSTYSTFSTLLYLQDSVIFTLSYTSVGRFLLLTTPSAVMKISWIFIALDKGPRLGKLSKMSWLDKMSWSDMHWKRGGKSGQSYLAMPLDTLVIILVHWVQKFWYWGGFFGYKNKLLFWASCLDIS